MNLLKKNPVAAAGSAGVLGAAALACLSCCSIPAAGAFFAWLGVFAGATVATGWYIAGWTIGIALALLAGLAALIAWRRVKASKPASDCGCGGTDRDGVAAPSCRL